jgi:hypothetical protein
MQTPPVTVGDVQHSDTGLLCLIDLPVCLRLPHASSRIYRHPDAAWHALAIALRPVFASIAPVIEVERARRTIDAPPPEIMSVINRRHNRVRVSEDDATLVVDWLAEQIMPEIK